MFINGLPQNQLAKSIDRGRDKIYDIYRGLKEQTEGIRLNQHESRDVLAFIALRLGASGIHCLFHIKILIAVVFRLLFLIKIKALITIIDVKA